MSLLGIDVGTTGCKAVAFNAEGTGCKAVAFNAEGKILASAYREYPLLSPQPGWMELDAHQVSEAIKAVIREVAGATQSDPIRALSVSSQGEAAVPLSEDGEILYNTPISFDTRTTEIAEWWRTQLSPEAVFGITGMPLHPMHTISRMIWMREHEPAVFGRLEISVLRRIRVLSVGRSSDHGLFSSRSADGLRRAGEAMVGEDVGDRRVGRALVP
jgi:xylulokinase